MNRKLTILVAPLDWGLGHATRCIPIINELILKGVNVVIAADGNTRLLLQNEFPQLDFLSLFGYKIKYSRNKHFLLPYLALQIPLLLITAFKEHQWIKKVVKKKLINGIISDNRFGLHVPGIPTVYLTHQLQVKTGGTVGDWVVKKMHTSIIKKYTHCWVPDFEIANSISGNLGHPAGLPGNVKYIGCLSRFERSTPVEKKTDLLIIISGPEPQRSIFEKLLIVQLKNYKGTVLFVRGLPGLSSLAEDKFKEQHRELTQVIFKKHLPAKQLNEAVQSASMVISRSGYTTVMDLVKLKQKAILIPTPGQTEQEYLSEFLMQKKIFFSVQQEDLLLPSILAQAEKFPYTFPATAMDQYKMAIHQFVDSL